MIRFQVPPTPKQLARLNTSKTGDLTIPDSWQEFCRTLTIKSGKGYAKFNPYDYQIRLNELIDQYRSVMIAKGRQQGLSEFCLSKILWELLKTSGFNAVVISKTGLDSYKLGNRMILMLDSIELPTIRKSSAEIVLKNGSRVCFTFPGATASVGEMSVGLILIDEASKIKELELTISAALPATAMVDDVICLIVFTPSGKTHHSFKLLNESNPESLDLLSKIQEIREGKEKPLYWWVDKDNWLKVLLHWKAHPIYSQNPNYLLDTAKRQKMPYAKVLREYDLSFSESDLQYIPDELIESCSLGNYEDPLDGARYFGGLDSSSVGADYFCFAILKLVFAKLSLVHLYRARRKTMKRHLRKILELIDSYDIESTAVETNSFGQLYFEELSDERKLKHFVGFNASRNSNIRILEALLIRMENNTLLYPNDGIITREFRGLEQDPLTGKIQAGSTGADSDDEDNELHDDIPRAIALALHAYDNRPISGSIDREKLKKALRDNGLEAE